MLTENHPTSAERRQVLRETWFKLVTDPCAVVRGNCANSVLGLQIVTASSYQIWLLVSFFFGSFIVSFLILVAMIVHYWHLYLYAYMPRQFTGDTVHS